jgi:hypothetical protein
VWQWASGHILEVLILIATAVEAGALVVIYLLEKRQFELGEARKAVDLRVDIEFPEGQTSGAPVIWVENAGAGSGFIDSVQLVVTSMNDNEQWIGNCQMAGRRTLAGFASVEVGISPLLDELNAQPWLAQGQATAVRAYASAAVLAGGRDTISKNSRRYRTSVSRDSGHLSQLIPD